MAISVGSFLINNHIPKEFRVNNSATASDISKSLNNWAKNDPDSYANNIPKIKRIADDIALHEGFTVGLDDVNPMKKQRDALFNKYQSKLNKAKSIKEQKKILIDATNEGANLAYQGSGSMVDMVRTNARGNKSQLMKNIFSPISAKEPDGTPYPYLIKNSYAEGLTPAETWVASMESRNQTVETKMQTAEPGDFGKQLFNALNDVVVSTNDCRTNNGTYLKVDDNNLIDRYLAKSFPGVGQANTLVTTKVVQAAKKNKIKELLVRSPMTCEARNGVCQKCYGVRVNGSVPQIGFNAGTVAAQSLSEPLTQMMLSSKHGVGLSGPVLDEIGMRGARKLLTKPKLFPNKAALSQIDGTVDQIRKAPQGGHYIYVNGMEHYVPVNNDVTIKVKSKVKAGDSLSSGLKDPREFTNLRGLGSGRSYMVKALYNAYNPKDSKGKRNGIPIDKRHLEILAKKDLNHVVIDNQSDTFSKGDVVEYNQLKDYLAKSRSEVKVDDSVGEYLGKEYLHYTVGTRITPHMADTLKSRGINKVMISKRKIEFSPHVVNLRRIPLLKKDFMARLTHSDIKNTLINAATLSEESEITGYDPVHKYVRGVGFGEGPDGKY